MLYKKFSYICISKQQNKMNNRNRNGQTHGSQIVSPFQLAVTSIVFTEIIRNEFHFRAKRYGEGLCYGTLQDLTPELVERFMKHYNQIM